MIRRQPQEWKVPLAPRGKDMERYAKNLSFEERFLFSSVVSGLVPGQPSGRLSVAFTNDETIWERYAGFHESLGLVRSVAVGAIQDARTASYLKCSYTILVVAETLLSTR